MEPKKPKNPLVAALSAVFKGFDLARRLIINGIFFFLLAVILVALASDDGPTVPSKAALVIDPVGNLTEQLAGEPFDRALQSLVGEEEPEVLMSDLLDALRAARDDDRIQVLVLRLDALGGAGLTKLQQVRAEIDAFRASGKQVIAYSDGYGRNAYYLASTADTIYMHPLGGVLIDGYGRFKSYHKQGIDRLGLDWNIFKVGTYKSAVEPFMRDSMSDAAKEANIEWMGDLWEVYLEEVASARGMTAEELQAGIDEMVDRLRGVQGDFAKMAIDDGLVDELANRDEVRQKLIELVGEDDDKSYNHIGFEDYLVALGNDRPSQRRGKGEGKVAVVVAKGTILDGSQPPGTIGGDSTARLIRQARHDDDVQAIVLRVDSGGGSAFASEVIRRELELARADGKKVVVSMGSVAASGGYWISTSSDEIWAAPTTITGSIGIFGMFPTYQKPLEEHLGTRVDGVGTTWLAGALRPDRALDPRVGEALQMAIEQGYREFLDRVGKARDMSFEQIDPIAQGRVWSGQDAFDLGLVDKLGDLDQAIDSAIQLAGLDDPEIQVIEPEVDFTDQLLVEMMSQAGAWLPRAETTGTPTLADHMLGSLKAEVEALGEFNDPHGVYAMCFCAVD